MAHLPQKQLPEFDPRAQAKTLFLPAPGTVGTLVVMTPRPSKKTRRFPNAGAALAWCERNRVNLVFFFPHDPTQN